MALIRAMTSGVSGLRNFQTAIDVIGNNISNVNTIGFKSARTTFQDTINQAIRFATAPGTNTGGVNPSQVGMGSLTAAVDMRPTQGTFEVTGKNTDVAVDGNGFFVIQSGGTQKFARDGNFRLNANNVLTTARGDFVQGFQANAAGVITNNTTPGNLSIPVGQMTISRATSTASYGGNIDASVAFPAGFAYPPIPVGVTSVPTTVRVYDSLGVGHDLRVTFIREALDGGGNSRVHFHIEKADAADLAYSFDPANPVDNGVLPTLPTITSPADPSGEIEFNSSGVAVNVHTSAGSVPANTYTLRLDYTNGAASNQDIVIDLSSMTQLAGTSTAAAQNQNGLQSGSLFNFSIGLDGTITGLFTNGLQQTIGQLALANFVNPAGLSRSGNNLFEETTNSGIAQIGTPSASGRGNTVGGSLESSNVDVSEEFTKLIVAQRAFQANSRVVTVSDDLLQELVNIIRR